MVMSDILCDRAANTEVKKPEISDKCHKQRPNTIGGSAKVMYDIGRKKKTDDRDK